MEAKEITRISRHLCRLLRHQPQLAHLEMDAHGWVDADQLVRNVAAEGYPLTRQLLEEIVADDQKGRYRFSPDGRRIKACQGHSIPWVEPELEEKAPPELLYHGTTAQALEKIRASGAILRMGRHGVHMQAEEQKAWPSARRWQGKTPVVLEIDAGRMAREGVVFGVSDNQVWICPQVPVEYILRVLWQPTDPDDVP